MNKKLKIFLALTLVIQLLVPVFLIWYQYSVLNTAASCENEYRFRLSYINFSDDDTMHFATDAMFYASKNYRYTVVTYTKNIVRAAPKYTPEDDTDEWFYGNTYIRNRTVTADKYSFTDEASADRIKSEIRTETQKKGTDTSIEFPYLSAKIYKGAFIPVAIYFKGEKIIDISLYKDFT